MRAAAFLTLLLVVIPGNALAYLKGVRTVVGNESSNNKHNGPSPQELCSAFMIYDFVTRKMQRESPIKEIDRNGIDWSSACPPLQHLNPELCPTGKYLHVSPKIRPK